MLNLDDIINENNKEHNEKWPYVPDHSYRILIIGGSGSGKPNLKNIEEKSGKQLKTIEDQGEKRLDAISAFVKNELKELAAREEDIDYKKLFQEIFSYGFNFLGRYGTPYTFLKNAITNKLSLNTSNNDQKDFVFNLMKGCNVSSFF